MLAKSPRAAALRSEETRRPKGRANEIAASILSVDALDDRIAIVGTAGSGKTYAAKGFVERLLDSGARVAVVDPLGVWWGLRASADGAAPGYPVVVFGGRHADVAISAEMGAALAHRHPRTGEPRAQRAPRTDSIVGRDRLAGPGARRERRR
jgi:Helicase HerA, central domain